MYQKIKANIKEAMKNHNTIQKDVLKMVLDKARAIMKQKNPSCVSEEIPDCVILQAVQQEVNQLRKAIEEMKKDDTKSESTKCQDSGYFKETEQKISVLQEYLPRQMTREEVEAAVHEILAGGDYVGFGLMMKAVMAKLRGKADARLIKEVVESL